MAKCPEKICQNCKYWDSEGWLDDYDDGFNGVPMGYCEKLVSGDNDYVIILNQVLGNLIMITSFDFSCKLWEANVDED
jgi:hypothetical protein